jgi:hypothetical protein
MSRPLKEIDANEVFEMAKDGCTQEEIADHFGCARSVISERFRQDFQLGKAASKTSLRKLQFDKARAGSDTMLIHLGKVYLGQTDRMDLTTNGQSLARPFETVRNERDGTVLSATETVGVLHEPG